MGRGFDVDSEAEDGCPRFGDGVGTDEDAAAADTHFDELSFTRNSSRDEGASQQWNDR